MKGLGLVFVVLLLLASFASAEVSFFGVADKTYNLGDTIEASFDVSYNGSEPADALLGLRLLCHNYDLQYYVAPFQLSAVGSRLSAPDLKVSKRMVGRCFLRADVESLDGLFAEVQDSGRFFVTDELALNASLSKQQALPADKLVVSVRVVPSYGSFSGEARVSLDGNTVLLTNDSDFFYLLELDKGVRSGEHKVLVEVNDSLGNAGRKELNFSVKPVASEILLDMNRQVFSPGETLRYSVKLLDQAGEKIPAEVSSQLLSPGGKDVFSGRLVSGSAANFSFGQFFAPGVYNLRVSAAGLEAVQKITVSGVEDVDVSFDNRTVRIVNIGNVPYEKTVEIRLAKDGKDYIVIREVSLKPNESESVDLFKKVDSSGSYDVEIKEQGEEPVLYEDVELEDRRSVIDKAGAGFGAITGNLFGLGGKEPLLSRELTIAAVVIMALILFYFLFSRGKKGRDEQLMKRKRDEFDAERRKKEILERRKLEEARKHKYHLDKSLREREDVKRFLKQQQERIKSK